MYERDYYMESGLGYHYPAGTPAPQSEDVSIDCKSCGHEFSGRLIRDLGTADLVPELCPKCKSENISINRQRDPMAWNPYEGMMPPCHECGEPDAYPQDHATSCSKFKGE